jgi:acyl carrier protein
LFEDSRNRLYFLDKVKHKHKIKLIIFTAELKTEKIVEELKQKLKAQIIEQLNLEDLTPEEIADDESLFVDGLGLDSIDALELIVLLEREYGIKIENPQDGKDIFKSINTMAEFIEKNKK